MKYRKLSTPEMFAAVDKGISAGHRASKIANELGVQNSFVATRASRKGWFLTYVKKHEYDRLLADRAANPPRSLAGGYSSNQQGDQPNSPNLQQGTS
jgi:hypothetical protein